jgi:hypothetical protein
MHACLIKWHLGSLGIPIHERIEKARGHHIIKNMLKIDPNGPNTASDPSSREHFIFLTLCNSYAHIRGFYAPVLTCARYSITRASTGDLAT